MADKKKVLIAEDEEGIRTALVQGLEAEGIEPISASDGKMALDLALDKHPDLIVMDLVMPKMHGYEVVKALLEEEYFTNIPIIFLSNFTFDDRVNQLVKKGKAEFLIKNDVQLADIIERVKARLK